MAELKDFDLLADQFGSDKGAGSHLYGQHYEAHAFPLLPPDPKILEIGVHTGGSMRLWKVLFPTGRAFGIDIDPECAKLGVGDGVFIGDQADPDFLRSVAAAVGPFDLVVDDGSHAKYDILTSFDALWPFTSYVYVVEDVWYEFLDDLKDHLIAAGAEVKGECSTFPNRFILFARRVSR